ncbi:hypothetical protein BGZ60DRAFT_532613 [Tricladium varicosporioides]|nr:hypothetical protein BGZ60DRAFT_532613 [Hymenoscyphus varicosporioides]
MSAANSHNESSKSSSKPKRPPKIKEFIALGKELFSEKDLVEYDQLLTEKRDLLDLNKNLKQQLQSKDEAISKLKEENANQFDKFEKRVVARDTWKKKEKDLENKLTEAIKTTTEADENVKVLKATIKDLEIKLQNNEKRLGDMKTHLEVTKKDLESREYELKGVKIDIESMQAQPRRLGLVRVNHKALSEKFRALRVESHGIAKTFFRTELPPHLLLMKELESSGFLRAAPKKIPATNSDAAQCLRMATATGIIAERLCTCIFRPYYLPSLPYDQIVVNRIFKLLEEKDDFRETVFRLQLLAAYESEEEVFVNNLVHSTVNDIAEIVDPLLFRPGAREDFRSRLKMFINDAVEVWRNIRKSPWKGVASNIPENIHPSSDHEEAWILNREYDDAVKLADDQIPFIHLQEPILSLFPQLSFDEEITCQGCALWSGQKTVVSAGIEYNSKIRNLALSRNPPSGQDGNRQKPSIGEGPLTPPTSPSQSRLPGRQSFSDHTKSRTDRRMSF